MGLFDDPPAERPVPHRIGEELGRLSLDELGERIELLEAEIVRIRQAIALKTTSRDTAANFFKR